MKKNEIIALLGLVIVALVVTLFTMENHSKPDPVSAGEPLRVSVPTPVPPPAVGDPLRLKQTYQPGQVYRATTDYQLKVPGQHTRWGLRKEMVILLTGRFSYDMKVLENDGEEILLELELRTSRFLQVAFDANIELDLDQALKDTIQVTAAFYNLPLPEGALEVSEKQINQLLKQTSLDSKLVKELLKPEQMIQEVESLEGSVVRMRYLDGRGVRDFELLKHQNGEKLTFEQLSRDEQSFLMNFHPFPDPYIFPNEEVEEGGTWVVKGGALPISLPMLLSPQIEGEVRLSRQATQKDIIPLKVESGKLFLQGNTAKGHTLNADWTPRGSFEYHAGSRVVSKARLQGTMNYASGGKDFWVLQVSQSAKPEYDLEYRCEVLEGLAP
ncbi:hypothetical protein P0Y35_01410 [Kiritimatiellaeota bacterium B1221]|nr:hypothetical protein [Kiritimatiellaeota bacterium B1221]